MIEFYSKIAKLDDSANVIGVSPLEYVLFDCAR